MKRLVIMLGILMCIGLLSSCGGGGDNGTPDVGGPLTLKLVSASPSQGVSPLRVTFVVNISGGKAPYHYKWDFTNDGATDLYQNNQYSRTISTSHDYYLRPADVGQNSVFEAILTVTDSESTVKTSDPIQVVVLGVSDIVVDPEQTGWYTDEKDNEGNYVAKTGKPVYFKVLPVGGEAPYSYQWDFDNNGAVDSTVQNPQFTFTNPVKDSVKTFNVKCRIVDANGEGFVADITVPVQGETGPGVINPDPFEVTLNTNPAGVDLGGEYPVVELKWDPTGENQNVPLEPQLDMAIYVNPNASGVPPYEYYWDFENDGAYDSLKPSPNVPFYDPERKITLNPYVHNEVEKTYMLRVLIIDSAGRIEEHRRSIISKNIQQRPPGQLTAKVTNYVVETNPPVPYKMVNGRAAMTEVTFAGTVTGGLGSSGGYYEYQIDANGDDTSDFPDGGGWQRIDGGSFSTNLTFAGVGYYAANVTVRSVDSNDTPQDEVKLETPVSLVVRSAPPLEGTLIPRANQSVAGSFAIQPHSSNGNYLESREAIIVGGAQGTTPLKNVERITETFSPPPLEGQIETRTSLISSERYNINHQRHGLTTWSDGNAFYAIGGKNNINGQLSSIEVIPHNDNGGTLGWTIWGDIMGYFPLTDFNGCTVPGQGILICGGIHPPSDSDSDNVSGRLMSFDPNRLVPWINFNKPMITERYDACTAYANGKYYVIGGRVASGQSVATVEAFNMATEQWEVVGSPMLQARSGAVCETIGGMIYVIGGAYYPDDESAKTPITSAEVFNPVTGKWIETVPLPITAVTSEAASVALPGPGSVNLSGAVNSTIWYLGGNSAGGETTTFQEFVYLYTVPLPEATT